MIVSFMQRLLDSSSLASSSDSLLFYPNMVDSHTSYPSPCHSRWDSRAAKADATLLAAISKYFMFEAALHRLTLLNRWRCLAAIWHAEFFSSLQENLKAILPLAKWMRRAPGSMFANWSFDTPPFTFSSCTILQRVSPSNSLSIRLSFLPQPPPRSLAS